MLALNTRLQTGLAIKWGAEQLPHLMSGLQLSGLVSSTFNLAIEASGSEEFAERDIWSGRACCWGAAIVSENEKLVSNYIHLTIISKTRVKPLWSVETDPDANKT